MTEIDRLSRRLERERQARKLAETVAEQKTAEAFEANARLQRLNQDLEELVRQRTAELAQARDEAMAASRAKSQFLASMSHELRTPLNAIIGYSEMLLEEAQELGYESLAPDLGKIRAAGKHLLSVINDILDLSKIEAGKMDLFVEEFDVAEMLAQVRSVIEPLMAKNGNTFEVHAAPDLGAMRSDQTKVRQNLFNVLSNAAKFTRNGRVTLRARRLATVADDRLEFEIADTGIGMTPKQMARLFQAFSQAEASTARYYGGTGLGLAITKHFCRMLGGDIAAESAYGRGTTFTITLPAAIHPVREEERKGGQGAVVATGASGTVLAIDDDRAVHEFLERELGARGYRVVRASGGREGLRLAREVRPDAITLDLIMPDMNGWVVLQKLKADPELRDIPVVLVTVLGDRDLGFALGAADFITKPIEAEVLLRVLGRFRPADDQAEILVVDDDPAARDVLRRMLAKQGWTVSEAGNGREALEALARTRPALVFLDLMMPEVDGFEVLEAMRRSDAWREVPVVVVTAKDLSRKERQWLRANAEEVFRKGAYDRTELIGIVHAILVGRVASAAPARSTGCPAPAGL